MKRFFNHENKKTAHIELDTKKCKACWKCLEKCSNDVIGKVNILWHKHALIVKPDKCSGCLKCVEICQYNAYKKIITTMI